MHFLGNLKWYFAYFIPLLDHVQLSTLTSCSFVHFISSGSGICLIPQSQISRCTGFRRSKKLNWRNIVTLCNIFIILKAKSCNNLSWNKSSYWYLNSIIIIRGTFLNMTTFHSLRIQQFFVLSISRIISFSLDYHKKDNPITSKKFILIPQDHLFSASSATLLNQGAQREVAELV